MDEPSSPAPSPSGGQLLIYHDGATRLQVRLDGQTVWLTQAAMADLFQTTPQNITIHLQSIYDEGELDEAATCKEYLQVRQEGGVAFVALCGTTAWMPFWPSAIACGPRVSPVGHSPPLRASDQGLYAG